MRPKTIITCIQNILPMFDANMKHGLKQTNHMIFTNKYASTLRKHQREIEQIKKLKNTQFICNYQSAWSNLKKANEVILLVGDPHHHLHQQIKRYKIITLEEMCTVFPEKVPLSYRSRQTAPIRRKIEQRMGISLQKQPNIKHILLTSHNIKMWDQAIQVILDHQPSDIIVQYERPSYGGSAYTLRMSDFITALSTCHQIVYNTPLPKLIDFNKDNKHVRWLIEQVRKENDKGVIVVDQDLVDERQKLNGKNIDVERVDENSQLWY